MSRKRRQESEQKAKNLGISLAKKVKILKDESRTLIDRVCDAVPGSKGQHTKCSRTFFNQSGESLARSLLGKKLVRQFCDGTRVSGIIVETEAYLGEEDKAAHSYKGKKTTRNEAMFMQPGTIYVYHIYGIYTCMNISAQGDGVAVLLRAIDPVEGEDLMRRSRGAKRPDGGQGLKIKELCSGPSKLTTAFQIDKETFNKADITNNPLIWLEDLGAEVKSDDIIVTSRIGVNYAEEWTKKPLRFYIQGNQSVSIRDKVAEAEQR